MHSTDNGTESSGGDQQHPHPHHHPHQRNHHVITPTSPVTNTIRTLANNNPQQLPGSTNGGTTATTIGTATQTTAVTSPPHNGALVAVSSNGGPRECAGCRKQITERFLLRALDLYWHEDCLKCGCCDCRLGEVGSTLYTKTNLILCKRDYLRLFGTTGYCAACNKVIPAFEMVMRAKSNVYHLECFACQQCNHRFCVGDRFYLCDNKILCEYDYEERLVFANMAYNPSSLAHIRRQVNNLQPSTASLVTDNQPPYHHPPVLPDFHHHTTTTLVSPCYSEKIPHHHHQQQQQQQHQQQLQHLPTSAPLGSVRASSGSGGVAQQQQLHLHQQQLYHPQYMSSNGANGNGNGIRDDGSSGYGSPDSETFDAPPQ